MDFMVLNEVVAIFNVSIKLLLRVLTAFLDGDDPSSWRIYRLKATLWDRFFSEVNA